MHVREMHLRMITALALLSLGLLSSVAAGEESMRASKPEVKKEIVATIDAQLEAFRKHDIGKAYTYASTALKAQKPINVFAAIVRANYPEIWANTRAEYGIVRDDGNAAKVVVHVFASDSDASYDYMLTKEAGRWRINGVLRHTPIKEEKV